MLKKFLLTVIGTALVIGAIIYAKLDQFSTMAEAGANMVFPPETVTAMAVRAEEWEQSISATGTVVAVQGVTIGAETSGRVIRITFESGTTVAAGDTLVQLDIASEEAQLASAEATAALARANLIRVRDLSRRKLVSQADLDAADARAKEAEAQVGTIRALIAKKTIRAPFTGRLALRQINLGQILSEGDPIVSLQTLNPIYVDFSVPQQQISRLHDGMQVRLTTDAAPGEVFVGQISAVSPEIDPVTRNVRVRALVDNSQEKLYAGMFASVDIVLPERQAVLALPVTAVLYAPYGDSVFVVEEHKNEESGQIERTLRQQFVRLGEARGDFVDVLEGLKSDEIVVTSGVFKLRSGMSVVIDNTLAPTPSLNPQPADA
ncbi:MAG: efflux RND transporter periplasmic adaptor subunit [Candidatus Competibacteraceae bacterium]|nr:efflux RND transporter periplasmic adaptor subunit [Candidatus Competibacteraceae bacterium]MCB1805784.1 efflux RND transporter periplasmic adaptor subunit [Candidatus Competibacteraceae bacterium]MCB1811504.1 efflux RND transporter periplasmic adaptor subunit [Candidatus Competibacteraceae bacterium]